MNIYAIFAIIGIIAIPFLTGLVAYLEEKSVRERASPAEKFIITFVYTVTFILVFAVLFLWILFATTQATPS